jgi:hypothetical protein
VSTRSLQQSMEQTLEWPAQVRAGDAHSLPEDAQRGAQGNADASTASVESSADKKKPASDSTPDNAVPAPVVVGFGDPNQNYVGTGIGFIPGQNPGDPPVSRLPSTQNHNQRHIRA